MKTIATSKPVSILIVDDEESIRTYVDRVLSKAGYQTTLAVDGAAAIDVAAGGGPFDLLLTDVMMPEMTGAELARRLRLGQPHLKVLYLTGYADQLFTEKVTLWEDEAFLEKPCSAAALMEAVSLAITGSIGEGTRIG